MSADKTYEETLRSPSSSSNSAVPALPRGRAKACTSCRQVKLKCNARETWPQPCNRCKSQDTECKMDSSFRRVPARRQLEEVSQKLNNLQRLLDSNQSPMAGTNTRRFVNQPHTQSYVAPAGAGTSEPIGLDQATGLAAQLPLPGWSQAPARPIPAVPSEDGFLRLEEEDKQSCWTLGGVTVTYEVATALFLHFSENKWHHIPVIQHCRKLQDVYTSSNLLFWTIILQAARNHGLYESYYTELLPHHRLLLGTSLLGQHNIEVLHAILLICTWPYPNPRQTPEESRARGLRNRDPSWMLLGAAINMATMMGLHKPGRQMEFGYDEPKVPGRGSGGELYTRNVTWLYVFQLSTSQSSWLGVTPPLSSPTHMDTIASLCRDDSIPAWMRAKADIQRRVAQFTIQLDTTIDLRTRYSLINIFEQYLDRAKETFEHVWSQGLEIDFQGAKLYLYGIAFVNSPQSLGYRPVEDPGIMTRSILQRGLTAASSLCDTACNMNFKNDVPVPSSQSQLSSYTYQLSWFPKRFNLAVAFASIFLAWFLAVDKQALDSDRQLARKHMDEIKALYGAFHHSQEHLNLGRKIGEITSTPITAPRLTISSRLGASFMYSYNFMYRYIRSVDPGVDRQQDHLGSSSAGDPQANTFGTPQTEPGLKFGPVFTGGEDFQNGGSNLPESWDMPWSEWDPTMFDELQNLAWDSSTWEPAAGNA